jgi:hypothetical protein
MTDGEKNEKLKVSDNSELMNDCEEEETIKTKLRFLNEAFNSLFKHYLALTCNLSNFSHSVENFVWI